MEGCHPEPANARTQHHQAQSQPCGGAFLGGKATPESSGSGVSEHPLLSPGQAIHRGRGKGGGRVCRQGREGGMPQSRNRNASLNERKSLVRAPPPPPMARCFEGWKDVTQAMHTEHHQAIRNQVRWEQIGILFANGLNLAAANALICKEARLAHPPPAPSADPDVNDVVDKEL